MFISRNIIDVKTLWSLTDMVRVIEDWKARRSATIKVTPLLVNQTQNSVIVRYRCN
jgi:hypothetical protein